MADYLALLSSDPEDDRCIVFHEKDILDNNGIPQFISLVRFRRGALEEKEFTIQATGQQALIMHALISLYTLYGLRNQEFVALCQEFHENAVVEIKENDWLLTKIDFHPLGRKIISSVPTLKSLQSVETFTMLHESTRFAVICVIRKVESKRFYEGCTKYGCQYKSLTERMGESFTCPKCSEQTDRPRRSVVFTVTIQGDNSEVEATLFTEDVLKLSGKTSVNQLEDMNNTMKNRFCIYSKAKEWFSLSEATFFRQSTATRTYLSGILLSRTK